MKDIIHNWREAHRRWNPNNQVNCACKQFATRFPESLHNGHVAIELSKVAPDSRHEIPGIFREIQRATRPKNIDDAAPKSHSKMAPQQQLASAEG